MYRGVVTRITVSKHPNADRLQVARCCGNQVVVGAEEADGQLGVFFGTDGQLSKEFCKRHDLVARYDGGVKVGGGFFNEKRRVRAQKFRGERSDGFWVPISYFLYASHLELEDGSITRVCDAVEGLEFSSVRVDGETELVCQKFVTDATRKAAGEKAKVAEGRSRVLFQFPEHVGTDQLGRNAHRIQDGDVVTITQKLHGTSGRFGNVMRKEERPIPVLTWLAGLIGKRFVKRRVSYSHEIGSRRVILREAGSAGYYGTNDFRQDVVRGIQLHEGEILYFEIVGWVNENQPIMSPQPVKDGDLRKRYGDRMTYTYGCAPGERKLFVYRITKVGPDGHEVEYSWPQVRGRCRELRLSPVPEIFSFIVGEGGPYHYSPGGQEARDNVLEFCGHRVNGVSGKEAIPDQMDSSHIVEGVVVRVDSPGGTFFLKEKSFAFGLLEGYIKDDDNYVDTEEAA